MMYTYVMRIHLRCTPSFHRRGTIVHKAGRDKAERRCPGEMSGRRPAGCLRKCKCAAGANAESRSRRRKRASARRRVSRALAHGSASVGFPAQDVHYQGQMEAKQHPHHHKQSTSKRCASRVGTICGRVPYEGAGTLRSAAEPERPGRLPRLGACGRTGELAEATAECLPQRRVGFFVGAGLLTPHPHCPIADENQGPLINIVTVYRTFREFSESP